MNYYCVLWTESKIFLSQWGILSWISTWKFYIIADRVTAVYSERGKQINIVLLTCTFSLLLEFVVFSIILFLVVWKEWVILHKKTSIFALVYLRAFLEYANSTLVLCSHVPDVCKWYRRYYFLFVYCRIHRDCLWICLETLFEILSKYGTYDCSLPTCPTKISSNVYVEFVEFHLFASTCIQTPIFPFHANKQIFYVKSFWNEYTQTKVLQGLCEINLHALFIRRVNYLFMKLLLWKSLCLNFNMVINVSSLQKNQKSRPTPEQLSVCIIFPFLMSFDPVC